MNTQRIALDVTKQGFGLQTVYLGAGDSNGTTLACGPHAAGRSKAWRYR